MDKLTNWQLGSTRWHVEEWKKTPYILDSSLSIIQSAYSFYSIWNSTQLDNKFVPPRVVLGLDSGFCYVRQRSAWNAYNGMIYKCGPDITISKWKNKFPLLKQKKTEEVFRKWWHLSSMQPIHSSRRFVASATSSRGSHVFY